MTVPRGSRQASCSIPSTPAALHLQAPPSFLSSPPGFLSTAAAPPVDVTFSSEDASTLPVAPPVLAPSPYAAGLPNPDFDFSALSPPPLVVSDVAPSGLTSVSAVLSVNDTDAIPIALQDWFKTVRLGARRCPPIGWLLCCACRGRRRTIGVLQRTLVVAMQCQHPGLPIVGTMFVCIKTGVAGLIISRWFNWLFGGFPQLGKLLWLD
jgi:hypothetical protein